MRGFPAATVVLILISLAGAQDQSECPSPRHADPVSTCQSGGSAKREITVRVAGVHVDPGKFGPELMMDVADRINRRVYRACDMGSEISEEAKASFQRMGYYCTDLDPIRAAQTGKNEYEISLYIHPGAQYRLDKVLFSGATLLTPDELRSAFRMKENAVFDISAVHRGMETLHQAYLKKGRPDVSLAPAVTLNDDKKTVILKIHIAEGDAQR